MIFWAAKFLGANFFGGLPVQYRCSFCRQYSVGCGPVWVSLLFFLFFLLLLSASGGLPGFFILFLPAFCRH